MILYFKARSTINNNAGSGTKKDIKESTDSNNVTIEDEEGKLDRISKFFILFNFFLFKNILFSW